MLIKTIAAGLGAACLFALPAFAFEIVTDDSGFAPPVFFADDPDGDGATAPSGNPFISSLGPYEYRTPEKAFDKGYSYSGYSFEDEKLADHSDEAKVDAAMPKADDAAAKAPAQPKPR